MITHTPANSKRCTVCDGTSQEGFLVDHGNRNSITPAVWHAGEPVSSFWTGTKTSSAKERRIVAMCCDQCGHIDLFAKPRGG